MYRDVWLLRVIGCSLHACPVATRAGRFWAMMARYIGANGKKMKEESSREFA
ncbi:MAG: hypothetical protein Q6373_021440 [Candidatus Sigynarchaeota archaeon]